MPISTVILFGFALIAAAVMAIGWLQDPAALMPWDWFVAKSTEGGVWTGLFLSLLAVGYFAWRGDRPGRKPKGPN